MNLILRSLALAALFSTATLAAGVDRIEVFKGGKGFQWHLVAANNEKLCVSQAYSSEKAAFDGANAAKATGSHKEAFQSMMNGKQHSWHLLGANHKDILCNGEGYANAAKAAEGIAAAQKAFQNAPKLTHGAGNDSAGGNGGNKDRVEVFKGGKGFQWHLIAANNEKLCVSQAYSSVGAAMDAAKAAQATGSHKENFKPMMNGKQPSWHLMAANHKDILCNGEGYANAAKAAEGITAAQKAFKDAGNPVMGK